jgi:very-long-chain ceramide synthase
MDYLLTPIGAWAGITKKKQQVRFAEQTWIILYHGSFFSTGMYIMYNSDYWFNFRNLWKDWPIREMEGLAKWYYLVEFAFWLQQIVVVNIEERRKDHWQMFTHHVITCALIFGSYGYHQTRVGNLIMCLMDIVDLVFSTAKVLKYLQFQLACDIAFGVFMVSWFIARHCIYLSVCYSVYAHVPQEIKFGCYHGSTTDLKGPIPTPNDWDHLTQPFRNPVGLVCFNENIKWTFLGLLLSLQGVLLIWFGMIMRVAYKVLSGQGADDSRSDDEDEEEEVEEEKQPLTRRNYVEKLPSDVDAKSATAFLEKDVLSTDPSFTFNPAPLDSKLRAETSPVRRSTRKKGDGHSSGVNLLAGSDRKDLLGRIGCDKPGSE